MTAKTFKYGRHSYDYELVRQERKTLSLTVEPCMDIILKVPYGTDSERIEQFMQKKWMWLNKQLTFFEKYKKKRYEKEYVSGESFYYLGRQYKLIIKRDEGDKVSLAKGRLNIITSKDVDDNRYNKKLLENWYRKRRGVVFEKRYTEMLKKFDYKSAPELIIRVMSKRWGSFDKGQRIILNPLLIQAPVEAIDYVITHELCHMKYKNHDTKFYTLLEVNSPSWQKTKEKLELAIT